MQNETYVKLQGAFAELLKVSVKGVSSVVEETVLFFLHVCHNSLSHKHIQVNHFVF